MTDEFKTKLDAVSDKSDVVRLPPEHAKPDDMSRPTGTDTDDADIADLNIADPRTCGTSWRARGQGIAGGGKTLPARVRHNDEVRDPIWLPVGIIALPPNPAMCPLALPRFGGAVVSAAGDSPPPVAGASPAEAGVRLGAASAGAAMSPDGALAFAWEAQAGERGDNVASHSDPAIKDGLVLPATFVAVKTELPQRVDATAPGLLQAVQQPVTQPAGLAFAAAIAAAQVQAKRDEHEPTDSRAPLPIAGAALDALHPPAIAGPADARQSALDLTRDSGLQGMIDHIEVLRDNADAGDTRIRLVPDALGAVDVSVRKDGDRVHVHFNAENAASARLLSDAQPRLADLADARGVKLGQTSVDSGAGHAAQRAPAPPILAAAPAAVARADATDTITDTRIA